MDVAAFAENFLRVNFLEECTVKQYIILAFKEGFELSQRVTDVGCIPDEVNSKEEFEQYLKDINYKPNKKVINLTGFEISSGYDRLTSAENLIKQLPLNHDGRNTWLLNYGIGEDAAEKRLRLGIKWNEETKSAETTGTSNYQAALLQITEISNVTKQNVTPKVSTHSDPDCVFMYCPSPEVCKENGCQCKQKK